VRKFNPNEIILTWDKKLNEGGTNFRKELVPYKEHRDDSEIRKQVYGHIEYIQPFLDALGIITLQPYDFEADDIIAWSTELLNDHDKLLITSSDKDLFQCLNEQVSIYIPSTEKIVTVHNAEEFTHGVNLNNFVLYKAIIGDISDNISGLYKYGPVKSKRLADDLFVNQEFNDILAYPASSFNPKKYNLSDDQVETIQRNYEIMDLFTRNSALLTEKAKYHEQYEVKRTVEFDTDAFRNLCYLYGFIDFIREMSIWRTAFDKNFAKSKKYDLLSHISM
jgi:5'-3' exonuclease